MSNVHVTSSGHFKLFGYNTVAPLILYNVTEYQKTILTMKGWEYVPMPTGGIPGGTTGECNCTSAQVTLDDQQNKFPANVTEVDTALSYLYDQLQNSTNAVSALTFLDLQDTPNTYNTFAGRIVRVNTAGNGLMFSNEDYLPIAGGTISGPLNVPNINITSPDSYAVNKGYVESRLQSIAAGGEGSTSVTLPAGATVLNNRPVYINDSGQVLNCNSGNASTKDRFVGMSINGGTSGDDIEIQYSGVCLVSGATFTPGHRVFIEGQLVSTTEPTTGYSQQVGIAISSNSFIIMSQQAITL